MPVQKSNLSTTASTRLLAAMPSKVYLAMHMILGGDAEARIKINNLARALVLEFFVNGMEGQRFLTEEDLETLAPMMEIPSLDLLDQDWDSLEKQFKSRGEGDPCSPAYIVSSIADLLGANAPAEESLVS